MPHHRSRKLCLVSALLCTAALAPAPQPRAMPPMRLGYEDIDLGGLPDIRAVNGVLETTLVAAPQTVSLDGASFPGAAFNGVYAGPVLRLHAGDLLRIHLVNHMPDNINLHFHGLRVRPTGHGDNMHVQIPPGETYLYELRIPPNHPPGLFWYHDHAHNAAEPHVMAGLSGALLIEGFARQFQTLGATPQKLLVLKDWVRPRCDDPVLRTQLHCHALSINGQASWQVSMRPHETQLWRISSQSANLIIHLTLPGLHMRLIGSDGLAATQGTDLTALDILPASRADVLISADDAGSFPILATHVPTGGGTRFTTNRALGNVHVTGPDATIAKAPVFPRQTDLRQFHPDALRTITFAENADATIFTVDGKTFDPERVDLRVPLGHIETWTIRNTTNDFHEFHIHQLGFQLIEINGVAQDFAGYVDDVTVPEMGSIKVIIPFTDPNIVGHFMYHCHVLKHEDHGMMANIEVFWPGDRRGAAPVCRPRAP